MGFEQQKLASYENMNFEELRKDSVAGPILEKNALEILQTKDKEYFNREFTGELDEQGYLVRKSDGRALTKPSQNIERYREDVVEMTRTELRG